MNQIYSEMVGFLVSSRMRASLMETARRNRCSVGAIIRARLTDLETFRLQTPIPTKNMDLPSKQLLQTM
jgi:hypothetical protein